MGGTLANPTYEQVSQGTTGHVEVIQVRYNPAQQPYTKLLEYFWDNVDPTDAGGQFCDRGSQYAAGIFVDGPEQQSLAEASVKQLEKRLQQPVAAFIRPAMAFYPAEDYHQQFYLKNPDRYKRYARGCGRDERLMELRSTP
jgi:peptide-methionine (S)-S-oxide reductase